LEADVVDTGAVVGKIFEFLLEYGDDAVAVVGGMIDTIGNPKYTDEEIRDKLRPFFDGEQREALVRLLASPGIAAARARLDGILGEDGDG
jgi:hypothetical protein